MFLTSRFVVELDSELGLQWLSETLDLMLPTRSQPNPVLQGNSMVLILSDGDHGSCRTWRLLGYTRRSCFRIYRALRTRGNRGIHRGRIEYYGEVRD